MQRLSVWPNRSTGPAYAAPVILSVRHEEISRHYFTHECIFGTRPLFSLLAALVGQEFANVLHLKSLYSRYPPAMFSSTPFTRRAALTAIAAIVAMPACAYAAAPIAWCTLAPGLEHGQAALAAHIGDGQLHIVRIDPAHFRFALASAAATGGGYRTARRWAEERGFSAVINAGMFQSGGAPVGYAKADGRVIQPHLNSNLSVFAFDDRRARLLDLSCDTFDPSREKNALQGIRMVACDDRNVWSPQARRWSIAAIAQDRGGRILFLHTRSPHSVHDFINALLALPLSIVRMMYQEGGPEATLFVSVGGFELERIGSFETGFNENDDNLVAWPLPNVFGVCPRQ